MTKRRQPPYAQIFLHWMYLPAWQELSSHAVKLLAELLAAYRPYTPNAFELSDRHVAERLNCSRQTAAKVIAELIELGWLKLERKGSLTGARAGRSRVVSLTCRPTETNATPTNDFRHWGRVSENGSKRDRKRPPCMPLEIHKTLKDDI